MTASGGDLVIAQMGRAMVALAEAKTTQDAKQIAPKKPGVYFVVTTTKCLYIGESKNLRERLATHNHKGLMKCAHVVTEWFECGDRKNVESDLIERLRPLLNGVPFWKQYYVWREATGKPVDDAPRFGVAP
jgi:excinuclease UvrABC nuclease subunit